MDPDEIVDLDFGLIMNDGGVDRTVIDCGQNQLGQMAEFLPLLTFLKF